jgi:hypothetical protein
VKSGRLERLYRETGPGRNVCDDMASRARALHVAAAAALGRCDEVGAEAAGSSPECAPVTDPDALIARALALEPNDPAQARRLFDRASRGLETSGETKVAVETVSSPNNAMSPSTIFSPDGRWLAGKIGNQLTVVDTTTKRKALSVQCRSHGQVTFGEGFVATLGYEGAPEEWTLIAPSVPALRVYSRPSMQRVRLGSVDALSMVAQGSLLAVAGRDDVRMFDVAKGILSWTASIHDSAHPDSYAPALLFDTAASELVVRESSGAVTVFATKTGSVIHRHVGRRTVNGDAALTPDGRVLLAEGNWHGPVVAWTLATGAPRTLGATSQGHITVSSDGTRSAFWGTDGRSVDVYDVDTWKLSSRRELPEDAAVLDVLPTPDGFLEVETAGAGTVSLVDLSGRTSSVKLPVTLPRRAGALSLSPDARRWAWMDGRDYFEGNPIRVGDGEMWTPMLLIRRGPRCDAARSRTTPPCSPSLGDTRWCSCSCLRSLLRAGGRSTIRGSSSFRPGARVLRSHTTHRSRRALPSKRGRSTCLTLGRGRYVFRVPAVYGAVIAFSTDGAVLAVTSSTGPLRLLRATTGADIAQFDTSAFSTGVRALQFEQSGALIVEGYGHAQALSGSVWQPRSLEDVKAARPISRCSKDGKIVLDEIFGGSPEIVATVTRGCLALLVRYGTAWMVPLPATDPVLILEGVAGKDDMFARIGSMVVDMKYGSDARERRDDGSHAQQGRCGDSGRRPALRAPRAGARDVQDRAPRVTARALRRAVLRGRSRRALFSRSRRSKTGLVRLAESSFRISSAQAG